MKLLSVEFVQGVQVPGQRPGASRWHTTIEGEAYDLLLEGNMVRVRHGESKEVLVYPWSAVRHAVPAEAPPAAVLQQKARR